MKDLLRFLAESVLHQNERTLKETLIGIHVFGREPGYDCKQDPVVRVEMRRLRGKLKEYYLEQGRNDDVLIRLEKGSYIPAFTRQIHRKPASQAPELALTSSELAPLPPPAAVTEQSNQLLHEITQPKRLVQGGAWKPYLLGSAMVTLLLGAVVALIVSRQKPASATGSFRVFPLAGNAGIETSPSFSPDDKQVAYSWDGNRSNFDIYVKSLNSPTIRRLTDNAAHDIDPAWSPEGDQIAFLRIGPSEAKLMTIPSASGVERVVAKLGGGIPPWGAAEPVNNGALGPVWSHDGTYLVMTSFREKSPGLCRINLDGREQEITEAPLGAQDQTPSISPSGAKIAFERVWGPASSDLFVISSEGTSPPVRITFDSHSIKGLTWLDDHELVYSSNRGGNFRLWQISSSGGASRVFPAGGSQPQWPTLSSDGHWLAFVETSIRASIWRLELNAASSKPEPFLSSAGQDYNGTYSPDGKKIAFVSDRSGSSQIWVADADGTNGAQVTHFKGSSVGSPQWSPDSRRIVFDGFVDGLSSIWIVDANGSDLRRLNNQQKRQYLPTWSRDGTWIYFSALSRDGQDHLWKQNPDSGESVELTHESFYDARESVDCKTLYLERFNDGIWQMPLNGGTPSPIPELAGIIPDRYWTLSGNIIYFMRQDERSSTLESFDLTTRRERQVATISYPLVSGTRGISVNPQRDALMFAIEDQRRSSVMLEER